MPMSADLLAAVGNITIGLKVAPLHRCSLIPGPRCYPVNGLTRNSATSVQTFKVLHALASLTVSNTEVISIGVQLDIEANSILLTLADNRPVSNETINDVATSWKLLGELSTKYADV